jgi:ankyrin repeat protein
LDIVRVLLESTAIQINQPAKDGATPLIIATYLGHSSIVQALLSNDNIDLSRTFEDKTTLQYSESHIRVASWSFLDDQINEEGRLACQELFSSLYNKNCKSD